MATTKKNTTEQEASETSTAPSARRSSRRRVVRGRASEKAQPATSESPSPETKQPAASKKPPTSKAKSQKASAQAASKAKGGAKPKRRRAASNAKQEQGAEVASASLVQAAQQFDRSALGQKPRVYALAKQLELTSRELINLLEGLGIIKVAQSVLSDAEVDTLLEHLRNEDVTPEEHDGKLRHRVEKNVENEIAQIVQKVDDELAAAGAAKQDGAVEDSSAEAEVAPAAEGTPEGSVEAEEAPAPASSENGTEEVADVTSAVGEESPQLSDVEPPVAPAPKAPAAAVTPLFLPPTLVEEAALENDSNDEDAEDAEASEGATDSEHDAESNEHADEGKRRRRGRRGTSRGRGQQQEAQAQDDASEDDTPEVEVIEKPRGTRGSTRLEAQRRRRAEVRTEQRNFHAVTQEEFLARRDGVERYMVVRERQREDHPGTVTQVGVLEDGKLVEHFVTSETQQSLVGNIYLGRVQNVLAGMEAVFIDIGQGRNAVLYAGEIRWRALGSNGRSRRVERALHQGDQVLVQVTKDPVGHKGARLTMQISLAGRSLVFVPGGRSSGISRKLPAPERKRLKAILKKVMPKDGGAIIRTAAEGVSEEALSADVERLDALWHKLTERAEKEKASKGSKPVTLYEEPNMLVKVIRDLFNDDFDKLVVEGQRSWNTVHAYIQSVAPDLLERLERFEPADHEADVFARFNIDEQLEEALSRTVPLPSGGSLVIDRTEAMTVIDVNTGKFTGSGSNLEETVTKNNLEAADEIVRQLRLRDLGGMIVVDFIDMVLPENQDLVLRRLTEQLRSDRTRHQLSEVTSLGLVQITRKRLGAGLLETFATECEHCAGRGVVVHRDPVEHTTDRKTRDHGVKHQDPVEHPAAKAMKHETPAVASLPDDSSLEALAAAVVVEEPLESAQEQQERSTSRRRRTRRAVVAKRSNSEAQGKRDRSEAQEAAQTKAAQPDAASAAPATNTQADGDAPQTYEEALAAFEASPRRKRKVRGNSRSDAAPRVEDFAAAEVLEVPQCDASEGESDEAAERKSAKGRRRRVVRTPKSRNSAASTTQRGQDAKREQADQEAAPAASIEGAEADRSQRAQQDAETTRKSSAARQRRRTQRRRSAGTQQAQDAQGEPREAPEPKGSRPEREPNQGESAAVQVVERRGRRRVVRKNTAAVRAHVEQSKALQASKSGGGKGQGVESGRPGPRSRRRRTTRRNVKG